MLAIIQIHRLWGIRGFSRTFGAVTALAIVCYGVGGLIFGQLGGQDLTTLLVAGALETLLYVTILRSFRARLALGSLIASARTDIQ